MKLLVATLAVLVLVQSTEGGWFSDAVRTVTRGVSRVFRTPVVRTATRTISNIPGLRFFRFFGKRDIREVDVEGDKTREQVAEILDLDDEDLDLFFEEYDVDGNDLIDEEEFAVFYDDYTILEAMSSD